MYSKIRNLSIAAAVLAGASAAQAAVMTLNPVYIGSTTATTQSGLAMLDLSQASSWGASYKHYFNVMATFDGADGEDFRFVGFDVNTGPGLAVSTKTGVTGGTSNKWFANNPTSAGAGVNTFSTNGDGGTAGDLKGVVVSQTDPFAASCSLVGEAGGEMGRPSLLGTFVVKMTQTTPVDTSISFSETAGPNFNWFTNNQAGDTTTYAPMQATGVTGGTYVISVPEPASLGLLGVSALGLLARRRKA